MQRVAHMRLEANDALCRCAFRGPPCLGVVALLKAAESDDRAVWQTYILQITLRQEWQNLAGISRSQMMWA